MITNNDDSIKLNDFLRIVQLCDNYEIFYLKNWDEKYKTHIIEKENLQKYGFYNSRIGKMRSLPKEYENEDGFYQMFKKLANNFQIEYINPSSISNIINNDFFNKQVMYFEVTEEDYDEETIISTCSIYCIDND